MKIYSVTHQGMTDLVCMTVIIINAWQCSHDNKPRHVIAGMMSINTFKQLQHTKSWKARHARNESLLAVAVSGALKQTFKSNLYWTKSSMSPLKPILWYEHMGHWANTDTPCIHIMHIPRVWQQCHNWAHICSKQVPMPLYLTSFM